MKGESDAPRGPTQWHCHRGFHATPLPGGLPYISLPASHGNHCVQITASLRYNALWLWAPILQNTPRASPPPPHRDFLCTRIAVVWERRVAMCAGVSATRV